MSAERRKQVRTLAPFDIAIVDPLSRSKIGVVVNYSLGGLLMLSSSRLGEGQIFPVELSVVGEQSASVSPFEVNVECLWCASQPNEQHWYGVSFVNLTPVQIVAIAALAAKSDQVCP